MNRAYSVLDVRSVKDDERLIEGVASTPAPDRMGDIVEPMGAKFALPMPLLWQHNHDEPIGEVFFAKPTKDGIPFKARLADPAKFSSEAVRERLLEAWESIKAGLVKAVSIGFKPIEYSFIEGGGVRFTEWEWLELSAVTIPAQQQATITTIKSIDTAARQAAGVTDRDETYRYVGNTSLSFEDLDAITAEITKSGEGAQDDGASASSSAEPVDTAVTGKTVHVAKLNPKAPAGAPFVIRRINHLR